MTPREALKLIGDAVPRDAGVWADLGAGTGTFTRALVERLGPGARIYAVDRDARALAALARWASRGAPNVIPVVADVAGPFDLPEREEAALDGILLANALHFMADAGGVLARLARRVRPGGRVVIVEYSDRPASRWVPYPLAPARLPELAATAGLTAFRVVATTPSAFGGSLYVALATRTPSG